MRQRREKQYWGKWRAVVEKIDDPKKMRRLQCRCPRISGEELLDWALPCDPFPTDWLPPIGTYVWLEFEGGDIDRPIWTGLCRPKPDIHADFVSAYGSGYRRDHDDAGNVVEWTEDGGSPTGPGNPAIKINGAKRVATEDLLAYIKTDILDWLQANLTAVGGWLAGHTHVDPISGLLPVDPAISLPALLVLDTALLASIAQYETDRADGGPNLTNKMRAG